MNASWVLANLLRAIAQHAEAESLLLRCQEFFTSVEGQARAGFFLYHRALNARLWGHVTTAVELYREAGAACHKVGDTVLEAECKSAAEEISGSTAEY
jgi:hypothetical protein